MVKYKGKEIIYSFSYSGIVPRKFLAFLCAIFIMGSLACLCGVIIKCIEIGGMDSDSITITILMAFFIGLFLLFFFIDYWQRRIENKYKKWLTDENLVEKIVTPFEHSMVERGNKKYRFGVTFTVNETKITKYNKNYDGFFALYENKQMHILYSPQYDEVLVLKD